jgi:hypothetical protein
MYIEGSVLSPSVHLPGGTEENHGNPSPNRYSIPGYQEYEAVFLTLHRDIRSFLVCRDSTRIVTTQNFKVMFSKADRIY